MIYTDIGNLRIYNDPYDTRKTYLYADIECRFCGKLQPVAITGYLGGPCCICGELTIDKEELRIINYVNSME
jgi:hypothetical protein